ncbi:MAG: iron-sulfur cluster assembly protein [Cypionkella sp.]|uniref:iron-sulfur cluster assembly protein n=1 Tax=Cypionkella sp. TaxID=2811411 RepID=UPI002AB92A36|nr:iron-sulfur cluster assembly protein [Cypionkella sp.]MDZ4310712.1 iron-sulfur cluster assembly protein [Cypionkella sp.]MDZ4395389.1 iron-sulfur cluster assembly protein [Cypionkella sp.]
MTMTAPTPFVLDDAPLNQAPLEQVWARLDLVMDPELDEPVTDMGFIEAVSITSPPDQNISTVHVSFRLPTYWCSPNFAFLMAEGIKRQIETLPWVGQAVVTLQDHMAAEEMNAAVNAGASFGAVFAELHPDENLAALREKFDIKAFQRRQEVVIKAMLAMGFLPNEILTMPRALVEIAEFADPDAVRQKARYLAILDEKHLAPSPRDLAFPTYQGTRIDDYPQYMDLLRAVRINMEFSGSLCRGLKRSRYQEADLSGDIPVLVDFTTHTPTHACR